MVHYKVFGYRWNGCALGDWVCWDWSVSQCEALELAAEYRADGLVALVALELGEAPA